MELSWREHSFADLCDITRGASPRPIHAWISADGIPWIKISDATTTKFRSISETKQRIRPAGRAKSVSVVPGDLIVSNSATPGIPKFVGIDGCIHDGWLLLRNFRGIDRMFCFYLLVAERPRIVRKGTGSVFTNLKTDILKEHRVLIPPLAEQRAIAHLLDNLDRKIELNVHMNETLEATARAVFKDWFVDFGPTRAKTEGHAPYLAEEYWELFPNSLDNLDTPVGWPLGKLDDLIVLQRGFDLPKYKRVEGKYPIYAASGVNGTHHEAKVTGPGVTTGRSGVIGNVFYVHEDFWPLNTSLWVKKYKNSSPAHAYFLMQTLNFAYYNSGSAVPTLNRNHVHDLPMAVPSPQTIQGFDRFVEALFQRIRANDAESQLLAQTRDVLLPKLVSGEIRVTDAKVVA